MAGDPSPNIFGSWLRGRRREVGVTQDELAERVGCSLITLQKIESGERRPSRQMALLLAGQFDVPLDEQEAFVIFARTSLPSATPRADNERTAQAQSPWRTAHRRHTNLPVALTTLIGREQDVTGVRDLILQSRVRLVTLIGPPGVGKTRLGLHVASSLGDSFEDGVFFIDLSPVLDPGMVLATVTRALGLRESPGQAIEATLQAHLRDKKLLLFLDNFEQVLDGAPYIASVLQACPWVKGLVTSREPLYVRGERRYHVSTLDLPDPKSYDETSRAIIPDLESLARNPSVELFIERAQDVQTAFELEESNARDIAAVCASLDGLPLAIELAAARVDALSPGQIRAGIDPNFSSAGSSARLFKTLSTGARDLPPRHRTLRNAIEWSYDLLTESERHLFVWLGVFVGGCTVPAVEAVAHDIALSPDTIADALASLERKSLVLNRNAPGDDRRLTLLETVREYAMERLEISGDEGKVRLLHAQYFASLTEELEPQLTGKDQAQVLSRLEDDYENIRAVLAWCLQTDAQGKGAGTNQVTRLNIALRICSALFWLWKVRGYYSDGLDWITRTLHSTEYLVPDGAEESHAGSRRLRARLFNGAGYLSFDRGDYEAARDFLQASLAIYRSLADRASVGKVSRSLSLALIELGDYGAARTLLEEGLAMAREMDYKQGIGVSLVNMGQIALLESNHVEARRLFEESLQVFRQMDDKISLTMPLHNLGYLAQQAGDYASATHYFREGLSVACSLMDRRGIAMHLAGLGGTRRCEGQVDDATVLLSAAGALLDSIGSSLEAYDRAEYVRSVGLARGQLGEAEWEALWRKGREMSLEEVVAFALAVGRSS